MPKTNFSSEKSRIYLGSNVDRRSPDRDARSYTGAPTRYDFWAVVEVQSGIRRGTFEPKYILDFSKLKVVFGI